MAKSPTLPIQERFVSLQGEGALAGTPSSFVRVSGCNLRCTWCDSPLTSWTPEGSRTTLDELVDFCARGPRHVVLTGGEPLLFEPIAELSRRLRAVDHHVTIETAGTLWLDGLECDLLSLSPKLAHSTPHQSPHADRHEHMRIAEPVLTRLLSSYTWQLKFVVRGDTDEKLALDIDELEALLASLDVSSSTRDRVFLMPEGIEAEALRVASRRVAKACMTHGFRLGPRLHIELYGHRPGT